MTPPQPTVRIQRVGDENEPVVVIDGFSGQVGALRQAAIAAEYRPGGASYPGLRARADPSYLDIRRDLMMQVMMQVFGLRRGIRCETCTFSLVTLAEAELSPLQRIPHYDHSSSGLIAVMHYLSDETSGGTAFYRHRRTGFGVISPDRVAAYGTALAEDEREYGMPPARYHFGESDRFTMTGAVDAKPDRLVLYRGRTLHSGIIPDAAALSADPATGRLTVNMFLTGA
jgi:hypothetical protein